MNKAAAFLSDVPLKDFVDLDERDNYLKYKPMGCGQGKRVQKRKRIESEQPQRQRQNNAKKSKEEAARGVPHGEFNKWLSKMKDIWSCDRRRRQEEKVTQELARQIEEAAACEEEKVAQELAQGEKIAQELARENEEAAAREELIVAQELARRREEEKVAQELAEEEGRLGRLKVASGTALLQLARLSRAQAPGIGWPPEEDARLSEVMANHKGEPSVDWEGLCVEHGMAGRSARECHDRWTRYLRPGRGKGQWTEQEDAIVLRAIFSGRFIITQWQDLAPQLPGRNAKAIGG